MRISRAVATASALLVTALVATGCVTVSGSTTPVEGLDARAAEAVLRDYDMRNNQARAGRDLALNTSVETGSLGVLDQASLRILSFTDPSGDRGKTPVQRGKPDFMIPRVVGWPKWFAVQATSSIANEKPQLLVFVKTSPDAGWQAAWGPVMKGPLPELARDADGYVEQVDANAPGLVAAPADVAPALSDYLADGKANAALFAPDDDTKELRRQRSDPIGTGFVRQTVDSVAEQFPPLALRTKDGGAIVLFALQHSIKLTVQPPRRLGDVDASTLSFLSRKPTKALTEHRLSEYVVTVPKAGDGQIRVVGRMYGLVGADGE